jgi:ribonuclease E
VAPKKSIDADELMIVNDSPGEECRIAILKDNHLEELYTERTATATNVGNIYKGRVVNVESAIQAAFVDFGEGANGFLHISDLHPKYFPGEERTERVGKKIPRRERPPIQAALRRGQEILVQVLKEGIGTKGPTLTSYLSIPGRLLVLMPDMDRVGVSRKVEDEEKRREMRQILDSLNLPDGFGFILRTAGFGETKTELKRDAAYLMRLWKVMEKRIKKVGAPCELYRESDLLIRTVRDVLRPSIKAIIVDSESAYERISAFLRVVTPRSAPTVLWYRRSAPIFHAFDIERQIELIHSREVPLASGGRLVIDQTEALVAIDVNSGRSRSARDSETNAYETNLEAADEICRQLRLRDLGGLIVNDLIDMRYAKHRKAIEDRFTELLKRDRAKATALAISEFGILEMTRQRMRPSIRKSHFMACAHCNGRGEIKVPEYVAADAVRHVGFLLQNERVSRVELVCSPRVASVMLSGKRREFVRLEDATRKKVDLRVSDAIAVDRVDYYAYDNRNADIDISMLPPLTPPTLDDLSAEQDRPIEEVAPELQEQMELAVGAKRGRHAIGGPADSAAIALEGAFLDDLDQFDEEEAIAGESPVQAITEPAASGNGQQQPGEVGGRRRKRRRRGGRGRGDSLPAQASAASTISDQPVAASDGLPLRELQPGQIAPAPQPGEGRRRRRRRRRRRGGPQEPPQPAPFVATGEPPALESSEASPGGEVLDQERFEAEAISYVPTPSTGSTDGGAAGVPPIGPRKKRRRRRGGGSTAVQTTMLPGFVGTESQASAPSAGGDGPMGGTMELPESSATAVAAPPHPIDAQGVRRKRRRRGRRDGSPDGQPAATATSIGASPSSQTMSNIQGTPRDTRPQPSQTPSSAQRPDSQPARDAGAAPAKKRRRLLYRAGRGSVSPTARQVAEETE